MVSAHRERSGNGLRRLMLVIVERWMSKDRHPWQLVINRR
jgi:hypothetical protein